MEDKIYDDPEIGEVRFRKVARTSRLSVRVHPSRGVIVTMPYYVSYKEGIRFFVQNRDFVLRTQKRQKDYMDKVGGGVLPAVDLDALLKEAREYLPARIRELALRYGFTFNRLTLRNNRSNWGSCSTRGNINLNIHLMQVPAHLRDYVILHELSHLLHPDHGPNFHALLESLCADFFAGGPDAGPYAAAPGAAAPGAAAPGAAAPGAAGLEGGKPAFRADFSGASRYPVSRALEKELKGYLLPR